MGGGASSKKAPPAPATPPEEEESDDEEYYDAPQEGGPPAESEDDARLEVAAAATIVSADTKGPHADATRLPSKLSALPIKSSRRENSPGRSPSRRERTKSRGDEEDDEMELQQEDFEELNALVLKLNPAFKFPEKLRPDNALEEAVEARKSKLLRFNASLLSAPCNRVFKDAGVGGPQVVPKMVVVTGHKGQGGNLGINGLYMRYADDFEGMPVYQKNLEKRAIEDTQQGPVVIAARPRKVDHSGEAPWYGQLLTDMDTAYSHRGRLMEYKGRKAKAVVTQYADRFETARVQRREEIPRAEADDRPAKMVACSRPYFLYYQVRLGSWCVSPQVGSMSVYAKCGSFGDGVPTMLNGWEVWDAGIHEFRPSFSMKCYKCGTEQAETEAPLAPWVPPMNCPRPRLENDSW